MKQLRQFIIEKFKISSKNIKKTISDEEADDLVEKYKGKQLKGRLYLDLYSGGPKGIKDYRIAMEKYQRKGTKPEKLTNVLNRTKLIQRWDAAMYIGWKEAAEVFKQAIIDNGYYTEEDLNHYIITKLASDKNYKIYL